MILEGIQEDLLNDHKMNSHIHDDHCVPTRSLLVSGSRASHWCVGETLTTTSQNVWTIRVEEEPIQQEIVEDVQLKGNCKNLRT